MGALHPALLLVGLVLSLGVIALEVWIGYLIIKAAVKNGVLAAAEDPRAAGVVALLVDRLGAGRQLPSGPPRAPQVPPGH